MCSPVTCEKCGKITWTGCGEHIAQALSGFSKGQLCACNEDLSAWLPK